MIEATVELEVSEDWVRRWMKPTNLEDGGRSTNGLQRPSARRQAKLGREILLAAAAWACTGCDGPSGSAAAEVFPG